MSFQSSPFSSTTTSNIPSDATSSALQTMSASSLVALRLDHLAQASQSLATTSPAVSGYMRNAEHRLANGEGKSLSNPTHLRLCKTCGSSLILGWNCEVPVKKAAKAKPTRQDRIEKKTKARSIDVRCSRCDSTNTLEYSKSKSRKETVGAQGPPVKVQSAKPLIPQPMDKPKVVQSEAAPATSAAKKRSRGKKSSLQSMLDSQKPAIPAKGFGLGLADFMTG